MGTQAVVGDENLAKIQQEFDVLKEEFDRINQELGSTKIEMAELALENKMLKREIEYKDNLIQQLIGR
jgi:FtsZ-binding cell division protein ZapB